MRDLNKMDVEWAVHRLPNRLREFIEELGPGVIVAGGFVRSVIAGETVQDIDIFIRDSLTAKSAAGLIMKRFDLEPRIYSTGNALTLCGTDPKIQIIHRWTFDDLDACLQSFDFTIAIAGICYRGEWNGRCHDDFYEDLAARRLVYTSPKREEEVGGSFLRMLKFCSRGYRAPLSTSAAVIGRLLSKVAMSREFFDNIDEEKISQVVQGLLLEVDPAEPLGALDGPDNKT